MPATHIQLETMEKTKEKVTRKTSQKQRNIDKAKTERKEELRTNIPRKKNLHSVGRTELKRKVKPVVDPPFSKQVEMPSLFCFSMNLQEIAPNINKSGKNLDHEQNLKMRERKRLIFTRKLHKMYQLAMAHQATFARILAKHSDDFGPDMDPLGSVKVYPDSEVESSKFIGSQSNRRTKLSLDSNELMKALDTSRDEMINNKQLVPADHLFPDIKERNSSSIEPWKISDEENDTLINDLVMLSVEDSTK